MGLKEAVEKLSSEIEDLATLEVTTYTGTLTTVIDAATGEIDWKKIKPSSGEVTLVAATVIRPDLDTVNFRANTTGVDDMESLVKLHQAAVDSAQNGRLAILQMFRGLLRLG